MYQVSFQSLFAKIWMNTEDKSLIMKSSADLETLDTHMILRYIHTGYFVQ